MVTIARMKHWVNLPVNTPSARGGDVTLSLCVVATGGGGTVMIVTAGVSTGVGVALGDVAVTTGYILKLTHNRTAPVDFYCDRDVTHFGHLPFES